MISQHDNIREQCNKPMIQLIKILAFSPRTDTKKSNTMFSGNIPKKSAIMPCLKYYIATFEKSKDFSPFSIYGVRKFKTNTRTQIIVEKISTASFHPLSLKSKAATNGKAKAV